MKNSNNTNRNQSETWTTEQLINLSQSWAYVFPVSVNQAQAKDDSWNSEQFIRVGNRFICL